MNSKSDTYDLCNSILVVYNHLPQSVIYELFVGKTHVFHKYM